MRRDLLPFMDQYREGRSRIPEHSQASSARVARYQAELGEVLRGVLPGGELVRLQALAACTGRLLRLGQAGEVLAARAVVAEIRAELAADPGTVVFGLLGRSQAAAAEAYVDYRQSQWQRARHHLREAFRADELLVVEHGLTQQNAHQLQLACNAVRSVAVRGRRAHAIRLAAGLLDYLRGRSDRLPAPVAVRRPPHRLQILGPEYVEATAALAVGEIARALAGVRGRGRRARLLEALDPARWQGASAAWDRIADWLSVHRAAVGGPGGEFLRRAAAFLAKGPGDLFVPWASVAAEACRVCRRRATPTAGELAEEIGGDLAGWPWVPEQVRLRAAGLGAVGTAASGAARGRPEGGEACHE